MRKALNGIREGLAEELQEAVTGAMDVKFKAVQTVLDGHGAQLAGQEIHLNKGDTRMDALERSVE